MKHVNFCKQKKIIKSGRIKRHIWCRRKTITIREDFSWKCIQPGENGLACLNCSSRILKPAKITFKLKRNEIFSKGHSLRQITC